MVQSKDLVSGGKPILNLELQRHKISCQRKRPLDCKGCPADPRSPEYDPLLTGSFIPPSGSKQSPLMVIGISGGEEEEVRGEALVGPSGRRLTRALTYYSKALGLKKPLELRKYNIFNCRSIKIGLQGRIINRTPPTVREMKACCERWLFPELKKFPGKVIFLLGGDAYKFVLKNRFDIFGKAMGHRLYVPRKAVKPDGLEKLIYSYGEIYETET